MIELAQHIEDLLLDNDCVIVPHFGGFVTHYTSAIYQKEDNLFSPPQRSIGFNPQLKLNDGVLVQSYMSVHNTSFADASRMVEKEVHMLIDVLHEKGKVQLENIGEIHYNIYGNYEFTPYNNKIMTPELYGLGAFEMQELSTIQRKEKKAVAITSKKHRPYKIDNHSFIRNVAAMIAAIVIFFAFSTPVENTYIAKNNYAQLLPEELFSNFESQSVALTPIPTRKETKEITTKKTVKTTFRSKPSLKNNISKPIVTRDIKVAEQKAKSILPQVIPTPVKTQEMPFHIIVAGGISQKDAEIIANELKNKGYSTAVALNCDGKIRVSILSFNSRKEATSQLLELRKNEKFQNAWLLAK